jgi:hypothetical protein
MKKYKVSILALALIALSACALVGQIPGANIPPRPDDHFQRNLVVSRIDLNEKINLPLISVSDGSLYSDNRYPETKGVITALVNGLKSGKYLAYNPDNLTESMTYEDVVAKANKKNAPEDPEIDPWEDPEDPFDPMVDPDVDPMWEDDKTEITDELNNEGDRNIGSAFGGAGVEGDFSMAPYESVLEFIENRIFDKNRSAEIYDIQYIRLVWVDPGEVLPDENFICLRFSDVLETLEATQWKNAYNDAEDRNMREIFEERIFSSFVTNVSGRGVRTLEEADFRRNEMLNFEHHLWSY